MDKFKNKDGHLSRYAFACGYIQRHEVNNLRLDLWHEGACYHVRAHNFAKSEGVFWESFENLSEAQKFWKFKRKELFK